MKVWVSSDNDGEDRICVVTEKPELNNDGEGDFWLTSGHCEVDITTDAEDFKEEFKFTPRKGSCKQYELKLEAV
jgi:hypothetical protein